MSPEIIKSIPEAEKMRKELITSKKMEYMIKKCKKKINYK